MEAFNFALLDEQGCPILTQLEYLGARVLLGRYHEQVPFLEARVDIGISYIWRSILEARELLKQGLRWRLGTGEKVLVWRDAWLIKNPFLAHPLQVSDLKMRTREHGKMS